MIDLHCPKCRRALPADVINSGRLHECRSCRQEVLVDVFPAAHRAPLVHGGGSAGALGDGAAACFFHDERPAQAVCDGCGRYVCSLCDVPMGREHLCPECLEARNRGGRRQTLPNERIAWDRVALSLALVPAFPLFWFFSIVMAPAALFVVFRFWRQPGMIARRGRVRFAVAGTLAALELGGWIVALTALLTR
jgi:hypothetical protein